MSYGSAPVLAGVALPRPSSVSEGAERVGSTVVLAGGGIRGYSPGRRSVVTLTWDKATEATKTTLEGATSAQFTAYTHVDGRSYAVEVGQLDVAPIRGTDPVKFAISLTLTEQAPR